MLVALVLLAAPTFSPAVVGELKTSTPAAGEYAMALSLDYEELITTELRVSERRTGVFTLSLAADGSARACAAARSVSVSEGQYRYEPPEKRQGARTNENVQLIGLAGRWRGEVSVAVITFDRVSFGSCDASKVEPQPEAWGTLGCSAVAATKQLPVAGLACEVDEKNPWLGLGLPLGGAHGGRGQAPHGRHVLLGALPGLKVDVQQSRSAPRFTFSAGAVTLTESEWKPRPQKKK
ncbi:MAG: hypothetical protein JNK82_31975 [Myxococcaceae bacterium]|nr:hypothetical protein [Myxococcaceae bacterium]